MSRCSICTSIFNHSIFRQNVFSRVRSAENQNISFRSLRNQFIPDDHQDHQNLEICSESHTGRPGVKKNPLLDHVLVCCFNYLISTIFVCVWWLKQLSRNLVCYSWLIYKLAGSYVMSHSLHPRFPETPCYHMWNRSLINLHSKY